MTAKRVIIQPAPAKVNLCLHVTGKRDDGYHLLDSLVVFADCGEWVSVAKADVTSLTVTGEGAADVPTDASNLVLQAAGLFPAECTTAISLHKALPVAAGLGGGSADAAATLRAMAQLWGLPVPDVDAQLTLGADVPVCMTQNPKRMQGIGEVVTDVKNLPALHMVLVNPRVPVPTGPVFQALQSTQNPGLPEMPNSTMIGGWASWLQSCRNDLEPPAWALHPKVDLVLKTLSQGNPLLYRMSGSGGTCFVLTEDAGLAGLIAKDIKAAQPNWWVVDVPVLA